MSDPLYDPIRASFWRQEVSAKRRMNRSYRSKATGRPPMNWRRTECLTTGEVFPSAKHAAIAHGLTRSALSMAILNGYRCGGEVWCYADTPAELRPPLKPAKEKPILCLSTGKISTISKIVGGYKNKAAFQQLVRAIQNGKRWRRRLYVRLEQSAVAA